MISTGPRFSVIIPNLNGEFLLDACLRSVAASSGDHVAETTVVDNGSSDRSIEVARRALPSVRILSNETNEGFARACNQGAAAASTDYLLFLNSDVTLSPTCLSDLSRWLIRDASAAIWQPKLFREDGATWDSAGSFFTRTGFLWHEGLGVTGRDAFSSPRDVFAVKGACMAVRRDAFAAVGGFDEDFFAYFEEADLCWRLLLAGWQVRFVPACCAFHRVGATTTTYFRPAEIDYLAFRNRITSIVKNSERRTLASVLPVHVACCLAVAACFVARGQRKNARAVLGGVVSTVRAGRTLAEKRRATQALRTRADAAYLPTLTRRMTARRALDLLRAYLPRW